MKKYFERFFKSKLNALIIVVQMIMISISYYNTYVEMRVLEEQCNNPSEDLNLGFAEELLEGYNGISFFANYIFSTDFFIISTISAMLIFSSVAGIVSFQHLKTGYGNFITTRQPYTKYIKELLAAQWIYIIAWTTLFNAIVLIVSIVAFPVKSADEITTGFGIEASTTVVFLLAGQFAIQSIYICITTTIAQLSPIILKNGIFVQIVPLIVYIVPQFLASTLGNINSLFAEFFMYFNSDRFLCAPSILYTTEMNLWEGVATIVILPGILLAFTVFAFKRNAELFSEEYVL